MKALFALRDTSTDKVLKEPVFESKPDAKAERDRRWNVSGKPVTKGDDPQPLYPFVVTYGPQHDKFNPNPDRTKALPPEAKIKRKQRQEAEAVTA
jgi:hypothetical protein